MDATARLALAARLAAARAAQVSDGAGRRAAVAAALRAGGQGLEVLLMRRAEREGDRWSGHVSLPGGHVEPTDADEVAAAIRETQEEVGVDLARDADVVGAMAPIQAMARGRRVDLWITPVVFAYRGAGAVQLGPEADDAFWFPLAAAGRGELDAPYPYLHEGTELHLPSWRFGERVVWGLTHKILTRLLGTLG